LDNKISKKFIDTDLPLCYKQVSLDGAVAQLGERLNGIQEVRGSIPRSSTINHKGLRQLPKSLFVVMA
jgi:hypothetical protein